MGGENPLAIIVSLLVTQRPLVVIGRHYMETPEVFYGVLGSSMTAAMK